MISTKSMNRQLLLRSAFLPGVISGVLCIVFFLALYWSGVDYSDKFYKFSFLVTFPMIFVAIFYFKKAQGGDLRFWQGMLVCYFTNLIALVLYMMFISILLTVIDPEFVTESIAGTKALMEANKEAWLELGMPLEEWERNYANADAISPQTITLEQLFIFSITGSVYSLILSVLFRK